MRMTGYAALAGYLERLDRVLQELDPTRPAPSRTPAGPAAIAAAEAAIGCALPAPLRTLYEVSDGYDVFWFLIRPVEELGTVQEQTRDIVDMHRAGGVLAGHVEGAAAFTDSAVTISDYDGVLLLCVTSGPRQGAIWVRHSGEPYLHQVAPSLDALLACWAAVAEAGYAEIQDVPGTTGFLVVAEEHLDAAAALATTLGCRSEAIDM